MASRRKASGQRKSLSDPAQIAAMLSHSATFGVAAAAKQFQVNRRTIQRHQKDVNEGKRPDVSQLIATQRKRATERCQDLLADTLEKTLKRLGELVPEAGIRDVVGAAKILGELKITRDTLGNNEQPGADTTDPGDETPKGTARPGAGGQEAPSVH
ncbi:MAG: hypothetical protein ABFD89_17625 [Bryobacteraceae bacterium]